MEYWPSIELRTFVRCARARNLRRDTALTVRTRRQIWRAAHGAENFRMNAISYTMMKSPIGPLLLAGDETGLPLVLDGTEFQLLVWNNLRKIPYGETVSYGQLARRIGSPDAARAVGLANGSNPIPIIIPCHRVIGSNGDLTGFGGGLPLKKKLLALESRQPSFL